MNLRYILTLLLVAVTSIAPERVALGGAERQALLEELRLLPMRASQLFHQGRAEERATTIERIGVLETMTRNWPAKSREKAICAIASALATLNQHPQAQHSYRSCLMLRQQRYGLYDARVHQVWIQLVYEAFTIGQHDEALRCAERARSIVDRLPLRSHRMEHFFTYHWLSRVLSGQLRFTAALPHARTALRHSLELRGAARVRQVDALLELARLSANLNQLDRAKDLYQQAIDYAGRYSGVDSLLMLGTKREVGTFLISIADYEQAAALLNDSIALTTRLLGPRSPELATQLARLGVIYQAQGDLSRSEEAFKDALRIRSEVLGQDHALLATPLGHLAEIYASRGEQAKALSAAQRALGLTAAAYGPQHLATASALIRVATLQVQQSAWTDAGQSLDRAAAILQARMPNGHPLLATLHQTRGALHAGRGELRAALESYLSALQIMTERFGDNHPILMETLEQIAALHLALGSHHKLAAVLAQASLLGERRLHVEGASLNEGRFQLLLASLDRQERILWTALLRQPENASLRELALAVALLRRSRSGVQLREQNRRLVQLIDEPGKRQLRRLQELRSLYAHRCLTADTNPLSAPVQSVREIEQEIERIESVLSRESPRLAVPHHRSRLGLGNIVSQVQAALPRGAVFVQLVQFQPYAQALAVAAEPHYLALILTSEGQVGSADLGLAAPIDSAAERLWQELSTPASSPSGSSAKHILDDRLMRPFAGWLAARQQLILALDGALHRVPFSVLGEDSGALADQLRISYVTSGVDLLPMPVTPHPAGAAVVIADPLLPTNAPLAEVQALTSLPGARAEAQIIASFFPASRLLLGEAASESALLGVAAPGILHIATHGLFIEEEAVESNGARGLLLRPPPAPRDPLLRSALVLADGAGGSPLPRDAARAPSDGIVTALELAGMDLWGTQLVVLSACSSGRGEIRRGQGVFGLRRAVMASGAETLITSLWKVDDAAANELMATLYQQLHAGTDRIAALHIAARAVRARHAHPYYWASFIALGRGGPLLGTGGPCMSGP